MVSSHSETPLGVRTSHGHFGPQDTLRPGLRGSHHLPPYSILCSSRQRLHPNGTNSKLESRNCPEIVPVEVPGLWELITLDSHIRLRRDLNQSCSPRQDLSNAVSHSQIGCREEVDSWLLVVANLTPDLSFAHNLGYKYPNDQCEAIFDNHASRPFHWHQEHLNARCFAPCCRTLNIRESQKTPTPDFSTCWASPPHLAKVGVRQIGWIN